MAVDAGDLPKPPEPIKASPLRMLFHTSGTQEVGIKQIRKHGLLANSPTLSPRVDMGDYNGGEFLTFWYPKRGEVDRGREDSTQTPTLPITHEKRAEMLGSLDRDLEDIENPSVRDFYKSSFRRIIEQADTYLPSERLRAVARSKKSLSNPIQAIFPQEPHSFFKFYNEQRGQILPRVKQALDKMELTFIDPTLNKDILAQDIIRTYVEHTLSNLGDYHGYPTDTREGLGRVIGTLQGGSFDNPVWERYRKMLISRFQKRLQTLPTEPSSPSKK